MVLVGSVGGMLLATSGDGDSLVVVGGVGESDRQVVVSSW